MTLIIAGNGVSLAFAQHFASIWSAFCERFASVSPAFYERFASILPAFCERFAGVPGTPISGAFVSGAFFAIPQLATSREDNLPLIVLVLILVGILLGRWLGGRNGNDH